MNIDSFGTVSKNSTKNFTLQKEMVSIECSKMGKQHGCNLRSLVKLIR